MISSHFLILKQWQPVPLASSCCVPKFVSKKTQNLKFHRPCYSTICLKKTVNVGNDLYVAIREQDQTLAVPIGADLSDFPCETDAKPDTK